MSSAKEQKTIRYYDEAAEDWAATHVGEDGGSYWVDQIEKFHKLLPKGKIVEIGSGAGKDAEYLRNLGYDYTGTDASKGLIEIAQKRNPDAKFVNVSVDDLGFPSGSFDGFWTAATLLHIPKDNIDSALKSIQKVVRKGGIGVITLKEGDGEREDEKTGRWFSYYRQPEFEEILKRNGLEVVEFEERQETRGGQPNWLIFYVRV